MRQGGRRIETRQTCCIGMFDMSQMGGKVVFGMKEVIEHEGHALVGVSFVFCRGHGCSR